LLAVGAFTELQERWQLPSLMTVFGLLSVFMCSIAWMVSFEK
jgi:hypothetical protein